VGEDFWLATWCNSTAFEGKQLEGTRITLVKMGESGYDFAIRTPCTPSRWDEFDAEMTMAWEVDWEAILNSDPHFFLDSVKSWLYPSLKTSTSWKEYPDVTSTFATTGSVVAALSSYDD
ncbi:hypothetical protein CISIN_1g0015781mg, partial [Citrus sinensis]